MRSRAAALFLFAALVCGGPGCARERPAPPYDTTWERVEITGVGWIRLSDGDCPEVNRKRLIKDTRAAFKQFAKAYPDRLDELLLDGLYIYGDMDPYSRRGTRVNGLYRHSQRLVLFRCGYENVLRHELLHHLCRKLDLPCDCRLIEHPGGFDERCDPIPPKER